MYKRILVAIEHSDADRAILAHVEKLAALTGASLLLIHVADGFGARHFDDLQLRESDEIKDDRVYLETLGRDLAAKGFTVDTRLMMGTPSTELAKAVTEEKVDLLAMATHGHRFFEDLMKGSTVDRVRHMVTVPVILVRQ